MMVWDKLAPTGDFAAAMSCFAKALRFDPEFHVACMHLDEVRRRFAARGDRAERLAGAELAD